MMKPLKGLAAAFMLGASAYPLLEVTWRGHTHWTMAVTGGACMAAVCAVHKLLAKKPLWVKCVSGAAVITALEFLSGVIINRKLHMNVWDYSDQPLNLMGQICLFYSLLWLLLCVPLSFISKKLMSKEAVQ